MNKSRIIRVLAASAVISTAVLAATNKTTTPRAGGPSVRSVLEAHGVYQKPGLADHISEAVRLTAIGGGAELPGFFERKVTLWNHENTFKIRKADPAALRERRELFDGQSFLYAETETGGKTLGSGQMGNSELAEAKFAVGTFGLIPILNRLSDPASQSVYQGITPSGDRFKVSAAGGSWTFCSGRTHLIRRVEIGDARIEYADYREVDGVQLPFNQKVWIGNRLLYELVFTRIDLNPVFPPACFTRESLAK